VQSKVFLPHKCSPLQGASASGTGTASGTGSAATATAMKRSGDMRERKGEEGKRCGGVSRGWWLVWDCYACCEVFALLRGGNCVT
jgi:hypothetical protein